MSALSLLSNATLLGGPFKGISPLSDVLGGGGNSGGGGGGHHHGGGGGGGGLGMLNPMQFMGKGLGGGGAAEAGAGAAEAGGAAGGMAELAPLLAL